MISRNRTTLCTSTSKNSVVREYEMEKEIRKQCQESSFSESQDWNSHAVCDNGVSAGMRLCAVQKDGPPDDVGARRAMTLGELRVAGRAPAHRGTRGSPAKSSSPGGDLLTSRSMLSGAVCQKNEQLVAGLARSRFRDTSRLALWDIFQKADG